VTPISCYFLRLVSIRNSPGSSNHDETNTRSPGGIGNAEVSISHIAKGMSVFFFDGIVGETDVIIAR
jgi:hypothetical protein